MSSKLVDARTVSCFMSQCQRLEPEQNKNVKINGLSAIIRCAAQSGAMGCCTPHKCLGRLHSPLSSVISQKVDMCIEYICTRMMK